MKICHTHNMYQVKGPRFKPACPVSRVEALDPWAEREELGGVRYQEACVHR